MSSRIQQLDTELTRELGRVIEAVGEGGDRVLSVRRAPEAEAASDALGASGGSRRSHCEQAWALMAAAASGCLIS